jgi:hypothetical protein
MDFNSISGPGYDVRIQTSNYTLSQWQHWALVRDSDEWKVFVDGTLVGSQTFTGASYYDAGAATEIGGSSDGNPAQYYFDGYIDEFRISKGIARWTTDFTPPTEAYTPPTTGPIDVMFRTCPNPCNIDNRWLDVAVLGTLGFDATLIDVATVKLMGVSPSRSSIKDVGTPDTPFVNKTDEYDCNDTGSDGVPDLVLKFKMADVAQALCQVQDGDVRILSLRGICDGDPFYGEDVVVIKVDEGKGGKPDKPDKPDNPNKPPKKNASQEALSLSSGTSGVSGFQQ